MGSNNVISADEDKTPALGAGMKSGDVLQRASATDQASCDSSEHPAEGKRKREVLYFCLVRY
jgi:hypothetical protein